MIRIL